jgi:pilus assembly protein CpaB
MRPATLVGIALLLGAVTAFLASKWVGLGSQASNLPRTRLIAAASAIDAGSVITASQIKQTDWHSSEAPADALADDLKVVGRVSRFPIQAGELVLENKLAPIDSKAGLSAMITDGKRAISIRVNEVIAVAGFTLPGNYVDVLVSGKDHAMQPFARTVINRAKVLAIAQETASDPAKPKVVNAVTLELSPEEVERLDLARSIGTLSLVLRNEADRTPWQSQGARMPDLLGQANAATESPSAASPLNKPRSTDLPKPQSSDRHKTAIKIEEIRGTARGAMP